MFEIHPSAEENFNAKIRSLLDKIEVVSPSKQNPAKFKTEVQVAATLTEQDIIGDIEESISDYRGKIIGRFFMHEGLRYALENDAHKLLVDFSESIQRLPAFRDKLSQNFIENTAFAWLKSLTINKKLEKTFISALVEEAKKAVSPITIYVPIANTIIQRPFSFCGVVICSITKKLIDDLEYVMRPAENEEEKNNSAIFFQKFRRDFQGYAAVEIKLECEPDYAQDLAVMTAQRVTSLLGIYSGAMLAPDVKCISKIKGTENLAQSTTISRSEPNKFKITQAILDRASTRHWHISEADLQDYASCGLGVISEIVVKNQPTEFESLILNTSMLYSKAAFIAEPLEKLVHILSALESTLLRSENEPIQQNLAERLAIFTSSELAERKAIVKTIKSVYGLRSRYLHHGHTSNELNDLSDFFLHAWIFYIQLLGASKKFADKSQFLEAIDDHKLG